jgi:hypothetical protein
MLFAPCIFIILVFEEVARAYYLSTACKTIRSYKKRGNKLTRVAYTRKMVCLANSSSKPQKIPMRIKVQSQGWQIGRTTQAWGENAPDEESRLNEEGWRRPTQIQLARGSPWHSRTPRISPRRQRSEAGLLASRVSLVPVAGRRLAVHTKAIWERRGRVIFYAAGPSTFRIFLVGICGWDFSRLLGLARLLGAWCSRGIFIRSSGSTGPTGHGVRF